MTSRNGETLEQLPGNDIYDDVGNTDRNERDGEGSNEEQCKVPPLCAAYPTSVC